MRTSLYFSIAVLTGLAAACVPAETLSPDTSARPNILIIMADDMGYSDLGCYGSEINTPTLNRLADQGMRFTRFYNTGRCCPSRASLLTGHYPHAAGMGSMTMDLGLDSYRGYIRDEVPTIAQVLQQEGYNTYHVGKWHVGDAPEHWPSAKGFDRDFTFLNGASSYYNLWPYRQGGDSMKMTHNGERYRPGDDFYMTDAFSEHAAQFISDNGEEPFFMYLAYTAPHWPLHALPEDLAKYRGQYTMGWDSLRHQRWARMQQLGIIGAEVPLPPRTADLPAWSDIDSADIPTWDTRMALYAAVVDRMDQGIGRVVQAIERRGQLDNTLIIFLSDNGGSPERTRSVSYPTDGAPGSERSFPSYWAHWANVSNTPFRFYKGWVQEGGIATPLIVHWPEGTKEPGINHSYMGHIMDLMATSLDAAGVAFPDSLAGQPVAPTTGLSLLPALQDDSYTGHHELFWEHEGARAVRRGPWKLVANNYEIDSAGWHTNREWLLFNLEEDPNEMHNVADAHPERVAELKEAYRQWAQANGVLAPEDFVSTKAEWKRQRGLAPAKKF